MIKPPTFKNYIDWRGDQSRAYAGGFSIRDWMHQRFSYEVVVSNDRNDITRDLRDIGENTIGSWSAYSDMAAGSPGYYFFTEEVDAMAFKLKFL